MQRVAMHARGSGYPLAAHACMHTASSNYGAYHPTVLLYIGDISVECLPCVHFMLHAGVLYIRRKKTDPYFFFTLAAA